MNNKTEQERFDPYAPFIGSIDITFHCICGKNYNITKDNQQFTCECGRKIQPIVKVIMIDLDNYLMEV